MTGDAAEAVAGVDPVVAVAAVDREAVGAVAVAGAPAVGDG